MSYEINEDMARLAHEMRSDREYVPGSATAEYQRQVDEARRIAEEVKAQCKTTAQRNRVDGMLDKYERTLAFYINRDNEIGTWCPSILIAGGSNFPVKKKERQNDAWRANLANYDKAVELLDNIRDYGHNAPINSRDPEAFGELLPDQLSAERDYQLLRIPRLDGRFELVSTSLVEIEYY